MISTSTAFRWTHANRDSHLWVVLGSIDREHVVIANVTTLRGKFADHSCVLNVGDHPLITHESYIRYNEAHFVTMDQLDACCSEGHIEICDSFAAGVMERILDGAGKTKHLEIGIKDLLRQQGLIF